MLMQRKQKMLMQKKQKMSTINRHLMQLPLQKNLNVGTAVVGLIHLKNAVVEVFPTGKNGVGTITNLTTIKGILMVMVIIHIHTKEGMTTGGGIPMMI